MVEFAFLVGKLYAKCLRKILSEKMCSARLKRLAILHERFHTIRIYSARKFFAFTLLAFDDRNCHEIFYKIGIQIEDEHRLFFRFRSCGMRGVSLLPKEF